MHVAERFRLTKRRASKSKPRRYHVYRGTCQTMALRWLWVFAFVLWPLVVGAQGPCDGILSDDNVQDCSSVFGGDGGPIQAQINQPDGIVLRSLGSDDAETGFPGSGGDVRAITARPVIGTSVDVVTDGGDSSGLDTGGNAGTIALIVDGGRGLREIDLSADGGRALGAGTDGDAGEVSLQLTAIPVDRVHVTATGATGGLVVIVLTEGATVEVLEIDADGAETPGRVIVDMAEGTFVGRVQLSPGAQILQMIGEGEVGSVFVGETEILTPGPVPLAQ